MNWWSWAGAAGAFCAMVASIVNKEAGAAGLWGLVFLGNIAFVVESFRQ